MKHECTCCGEQLELFPALIELWEEDAKWFTILRQRVEGDDT